MTARDYIFSLEQIGIKLGLEQIRRLLRGLDCPDLAFPSIIVGGTNGKGSVTAMIERGLREAGAVTGRYTSPHLTAIEERMAIGGVSIPPATFDRLAARVRHAAGALPAPPSFFEATTAIALEAFRDAAVDAAVLEVGLGGRLDATNAVTPVLAVITSVDLDHQQYLGNTLEAIAAEKAGIIKAGVPTVLARNPEQVLDVVRRTCAERESPLTYAPDGVETRAELRHGVTHLRLVTPVDRWEPITLGLRGRHQIDNAVTAVRALEAIDAAGLIKVPLSARRGALERVQWPGRLELRRWRGGQDGGGTAEVLVDGAHNPAGARALASYLSETYDRPLPIVFGAMQDKDVDGLVAALAPAASAFICVGVASPRSARPADLSAVVTRVAPGVDARTAATLSDALVTASRLGAPIVVAGSLYLAGEIRGLLS
jgi:dihydrofolate synthase/folylpolyglutamate synthase